MKKSDVLSILYSKPQREYRKRKFKIGERVRISKCDLPFRRGSSHKSLGKILKLLQFFLENLQHAY